LKKIIGYLRSYYTDHLNKYEIFFALLFVAGFVYLRFINVMPSGKPYIIDKWHEWYWAGNNYGFHFVLYLTPLLYGYISSSIWNKEWSIWLKPKFYLLIFVAIAVFCLRSTAQALYDEPLLNAFAGHPHYDWIQAMVSTCSRSFLILFPLYLFWLAVDRKEQPYYGFTLKDFDTKPYFILLLMMLPLIILASTQGDFLGTYPRGADFNSLDIHKTADLKYYGSYEFFYGLDFISIEFFFRGFLILAFVGIGGPRVIIPAAILYSVIHWNKPAGELISSFFGGTILGIVTYYSKSIIGGIIVHMGIAWLMEIGAFIGNYFKS
jgi:hypothetical protein